MPPNNQTPPSPNSNPPGQFDASQFDFIMNPGQKNKKSLLPGGPQQRTILFVGIIAIVVIGLVLIILSIFSRSAPGTDQFVKLAQEQNEIIRVSTAANRKVGGDQAKKLAAVTSSTITTDQKATVDYLAKQKKKVNSKTLALTASKETDADLSAAERNGRYDEVFTKIIIEQLTRYISDLKSAYNNVGKNGKAVLDQSYKNATLILQDNKTTP